MSAIAKLLSIASDSLGPSGPLSETFASFGRHGQDLQALLNSKNGFFAFESALLVRPSDSSSGPASIETWNGAELWLDTYGGFEIPPLLFFGEDALGVQFALYAEGVACFDPETAELEHFSDSLEDWAKEILADPSMHTAHSLAHQWQASNGALPATQRLAPKTPFVLGGDYEIGNLVAYDEVRGMRVRGGLAEQLRDLPDGAEVTFKLG